MVRTVMEAALRVSNCQPTPFIALIKALLHQKSYKNVGFVL